MESGASRTPSGTDATISTSRSTTVLDSWPGSVLATRKRVLRSTSVTRQLRPPEPTTRSPSQCPGTARSAASGGRGEIPQPSHQPRPGLSGSLERGLRPRRPERSACTRPSSWRRAPLPCTYRAWCMVSWLTLMAPLSGDSGLVRPEIWRGDRPLGSPAATWALRAASDSSLRGLGLRAARSARRCARENS